MDCVFPVYVNVRVSNVTNNNNNPGKMLCSPYNPFVVVLKTISLKATIFLCFEL